MNREEQRQAVEIIAMLLDLIRANAVGIEPVNFGGPAGVASDIKWASDWLGVAVSGYEQLRNEYTRSPKYPPCYKVGDRVLFALTTGRVTGIIRSSDQGRGYQCYVLLDSQPSGAMPQLIHERNLQPSL